MNEEAKIELNNSLCEIGISPVKFQCAGKSFSKYGKTVTNDFSTHQELSLPCLRWVKMVLLSKNPGKGVR